MSTSQVGHKIRRVATSACIRCLLQWNIATACKLFRSNWHILDPSKEVVISNEFQCDNVIYTNYMSVTLRYIDKFI
ncbi:hypothetical protein GJ496_010148 [Pomphorhynchus laevis]|nr:hypothetical protein GJ496_010148 [Pomphorhynchus laevis]